MLDGKLRGDFGFQGIVATDCGALNDADIHHNYSAKVCPACNTSALRAEKIAELAIQAGVNSNCGSFMGTHMPNVIARGLVSLDTLRASTARLLAIRFKLGLFEPKASAVPKFSIEHVDSAAHRAVALKAARQAIVLLQNRAEAAHPSPRQHHAGTKPILPLAKGAKVAMIGPNANASLNLLSGYHGTRLAPLNFIPNGGQFDSVRPPARAPHGAYVSVS